MVKHRFLFLFVLTLNVLIVSLPSRAQQISTVQEISDFTLSRPLWADYWGDDRSEDLRSFDISLLMKKFSLSRLQAVETQVLYRLQVHNSPHGDFVAYFNEALSAARQNKFDNVDVAKLNAARFIIVFDLDETAYDQHIKDENAACADVSYQDGQNKKHLIRTAPHIVEAFRQIIKRGGAVVLFSANVDSATKANLAAWMVDGKPLLSSGLVAALLTKNALIFQGGAAAVMDASKDLRIFDESLSKVIIVDDNPTRLFQWKNEKMIRTFDGNLYCSTGDPVIKSATEQSMVDFISEIDEAVDFMDENPGTTMQTAFLPFTIPGTVQR